MFVPGGAARSAAAALLSVGLLLLSADCVGGDAGMNLVPVGEYLYADALALRDYRGSLRVRFDSSGPHRLVLAYGRRHRKDRHGREGTTEEERQIFKPVRARMTDQGATAVFDHLPPDFYDLVVIDDRHGVFHEGLQLLQRMEEAPIESRSETALFEEAAASLGLREDRIGGWEAFFDHKNFVRWETDGDRGAMLVHQMRLGRTYAESGDLLQGTVHSLDVVWLEKADGDAGWQVITRQQLYRNEIGRREFFRHRFVESLHGIRVGVRPVTIGPVRLATDDSAGMVD